METFLLENQEFIVTKFLGKGKSGYSYLIENDQQSYVLKKIHQEPCSYYHFDNKFEAEIIAYQKLISINLPVPKLICKNEKEQFIVKQYISGKTLAEIIADEAVTGDLVGQMLAIANKCEENKINIDYFPTNFVVSNGEIWYIDYEFNPYSEEWNFENWGLFYWANSQGMKEFLLNKNDEAINLPHSGKPIKEPFVQEIKQLIERGKDFLGRG